MKIRHIMTSVGMALVFSFIIQPLPAVADEPCPLPDVTPALAEIVVLLLDVNHDGQLFLSEIRVIYPDLDPMIFMLVDSSHNGRLSPSELVGAIQMLGLDVLGYIDTNGDSLIQYEETAAYLTPEMFVHFDTNRNDVIDCVDYAYFMVKPAYGEGEDGCGSADMMYFLAYAAFPLLDTDGDDAIIYEEVEPLIGPDYAPLLFNVLDRDGNENVSEDEILALLLALPFDIIRIIDLDQNGAINPEDVEGMLPVEMLGELDFNGDGILYCDDLEMLPIDDDWGILPFQTEEMLSTSLLALLNRAFPLLDENNDNALSLEEIRTYIALPQRLFAMLDINGDGFIARDEIESWLGYFDESPRDTAVDFVREIVGSGLDNFFLPGESLLIRITVNKYGTDSFSKFSITEMLPEGWTVGNVYSKGTADVTVEPVPGANKMILNWNESLPMFPLEVFYELLPATDAAGIFTILGQAVYKTETGTTHSGGMIPTVLVELLSPEYAHSADTNGDWKISLSELLRVIQLYNSGAYHLNPLTEDGYDLGEGTIGGSGHSADYLNDWSIKLPELIRVIQLYNSPSRRYYTDGDTEDGYMPAPF